MNTINPTNKGRKKLVCVTERYKKILEDLKSQFRRGRNSVKVTARKRNVSEYDDYNINVEQVTCAIKKLQLQRGVYVNVLKDNENDTQVRSGMYHIMERKSINKLSQFSYIIVVP